MKLKSYACDHCGKTNPGTAPVKLRGDMRDITKGGILLPRHKFHFCSIDCVAQWLENAELRK